MSTPRTTRILLVEDHEDTALVAARLLRGSGYEVLVAGTVKSALSQAACNQIDVALCDIGLPDGDGCDLMRELREKYALPGIALTAFAMEDDVKRVDRAGFNAKLVKPIDFGDLCRTVEEVLSRHAAALQIQKELDLALLSN